MLTHSFLATCSGFQSHSCSVGATATMPVGTGKNQGNIGLLASFKKKGGLFGDEDMTSYHIGTGGGLELWDSRSRSTRGW